MSLLSSILLGLIQGLAEFLPISSSGHLAIAEHFLGQAGVPATPDFFDVLLHLGTLVAVFAAYWQDIRDMIVELIDGVRDLVRGTTPNPIPPARRMILLIIVGTLPLFVVLPVKDLVEGLSGNIYFVAGALIVTGFLLFASDRVKKGRKTERSAKLLDVLLVGILHWSVEGAAIATMLSQVVGGLLPVFYFLNRKNTSLLHLCRPQFEGGVLLKACVNGSSELMTNLSMSLVNILYNYQLLRFAGEDGVAAYGVIMYASFLFVAVFVGYAVGSAPIVSYHYGANNRKEVNNLYRKSLKLIGVVAVVMTIGSMFIIPHVARFFVGYDENLLILTTRAFRLYGLSFLIMGFNVYASSFFTALGDGVTSALISFLRTLLFQVAAVLLLPLLLGIDGIWLAVTAAELAALLVSIGLFITRDQQFHYRKAE